MNYCYPFLYQYLLVLTLFFQKPQNPYSMEKNPLHFFNPGSIHAQNRILGHSNTKWWFDGSFICNKRKTILALILRSSLVSSVKSDSSDLVYHIPLTDKDLPKHRLWVTCPCIIWLLLGMSWQLFSVKGEQEVILSVLSYIQSLSYILVFNSLLKLYTPFLACGLGLACTPCPVNPLG